MNTARQVLLNPFSALRACLRSVVGIDFDYCPPGTFGLDFQYGYEVYPSNIPHRPIKTSPFSCPTVQFFNIDCAVFLYEFTSGLIMKISSLVSDFFVFFRNEYLCFLSTVGTFCFNGKPLLMISQYILGFFEEARVLHFNTVGLCQKTLATHINTNFLFIFSEDGWLNSITNEGYEPLSCRLAGYNDFFYFSFDRSRKFYLKFTKTRNNNIFSFNCPSASIFSKGKRVISFRFFKSWETIFTAKEKLIAFIKSFNDILKNVSVNFLVFREGMAEFCNLSHLFEFGNGSSMIFICFDTLFEGKVIKKTAGFKPLFGLGQGKTISINTILKNFFHCHSIQDNYIRKPVRSQEKRRIDRWQDWIS